MKIIIATGNTGKFREFDRILSPLGFDVVSQRHEGLNLDVEETGKTFAENAFLKANAIFKATGLPTVADDSGLEVDALNNRPGVHTARYAGAHATDRQNNDKLLQELKDVPMDKRQARYVCSICYIHKTGKVYYTSGICDGVIAKEEIGTGGFGYDPLFLVNGKSFGETPAQEKDAISHRGKALVQLAELIQNMK